MVSANIRTLAYTADRRMALSADTRMPLDVRAVAGSNQKSPHGERSELDAFHLPRKLKKPIS